MTVRVEKTFAECMDTSVTASIASLPSAEQLIRLEGWLRVFWKQVWWEYR